MLKNSDIIQITPSLPQIQLCREMAKKAEIGGVSHVRGADRAENLSQDQFIGQLGQLCGCLYWTGSDNSYRLSRWYANQYPTRGDGGSDLPGANVDFKTSLIRTDLDPLDHNLIVRPKERHADSIYVLLLVKDLGPEKWDWAGQYIVGLVGWCADSDLAPSEKFKGAFSRKAKDLYPLPKIRWGL